ncbi:MAG: DUF3786 domain-containing protein [Firmicutes bacterium]|nr:DUF3786 domain-containing protein [Bacillota bacterium]
MKQTKPTWNNYEIAFSRAEQEFLKFDQKEMIRASDLRADENYIYITFFYTPYRIHRKTGYAERCIGKDQWRHCNYSEGMGIFDAICEPTPYRQLSGEMVDTSYFAKVGFTNRSIYQHYADRFCADLEHFRAACLSLGAIPLDQSDAGFQFQIFDFLPMILLLWEGEEGIPATMSFLWDKNLYDFIRFETSQFIIGHILDEISLAMGYKSSFQASTQSET